MEEKDPKLEAQQDAMKFVYEEFSKMLADGMAGKLYSENVANDLSAFIEAMCNKYNISKEDIQERMEQDKDNIQDMAAQMQRDMTGQIEKTVYKDKKE